MGGIRRPAICQVLLDAGFELNCQENGGSTALHDTIHGAPFFERSGIAPAMRAKRHRRGVVVGKGSRMSSVRIWPPRPTYS